MTENQKIAKFMGYPVSSYWWHLPENSEITGIPHSLNEKICEFKTNWAWIMPVVERINKRDWVTIYSDECKIHAMQVDEFEPIQIINEGHPLIKSVYEACLKYAEWFLSSNNA